MKYDLVISFLLTATIFDVCRKFIEIIKHLLRLSGSVTFFTCTKFRGAVHGFLIAKK